MKKRRQIDSAGMSTVEILLWTISAALFAYYVSARAQGEWHRRDDLHAYAVAQQMARGAESATSAQVDQSYWSDSRKQAYRESLSLPATANIGVLRIRTAILAVNIAGNPEIPLYGDTSDAHLNRGAGVIEGMALPGQGGNLGIAGHRDGYFRALKDVRVDDVVEIYTPVMRYEYRVKKISIVGESDTRLLTDSLDPTLTLVTCFPFYHLGHAPQRYIVQGVLERSSHD